MRAVVIGAVESSLVALRAIAQSPDWDLAAVFSLGDEHSDRHSDFVDLSGPADAVGADFVPVVNINREESFGRLHEYQPDHIFVIGWSQICGPNVMAAAPGKVIGYHPAPLPRMRGRAAIPWTILRREPITASTLFWIDDGVDSGPILDQYFFHVDPDETASSLYARHMHVLGLMLDRTLPHIARGTARRDAQDERFATWTTRRTQADGLIDWRAPADEIARLVRAVGKPYPGAFTTSAAGPVTIWACEPSNLLGRFAALPGQVIAADTASFMVACGNDSAITVTSWSGANDKAPRMHSLLGSPS